MAEKGDILKAASLGLQAHEELHYIVNKAYGGDDAKQDSKTKTKNYCETIIMIETVKLMQLCWSADLLWISLDSSRVRLKGHICNCYSQHLTQHYGPS